jgi:hypothetical protein
MRCAGSVQRPVAASFVDGVPMAKRATPDVLFRLITSGSGGVEEEGYKRLGYRSVHAPMPAMGTTIKTSDQLWKIIAFIRSINPPGSNPPDTVLPKEVAPSRGQS